MPSSSPTECSPTATLVGQQSRCNSLSSASAGFDAGPHGAKHAFPILPPTSQRLSDATSALSNRSTSGTDAEEGRPNFAGAGTATDPFVVRWLEGEKENPLEWSPLRRWLIVLNVSMGTLCVAFGSSVYAGGIAPMVRYFGVSPIMLTLGLSVYVLGFAIGPLLWAPLSELFGRRLIFILTYFPFIIFHVGCGAAQNIETMIVCRFFAGFWGSSPFTNSGGVISDTFTASQRALALSVFAICPFLGPVIGPIAGGFIGEYISWRWLFWVQTIFAVICYGAGVLTPETYSPVLLRWRATKLSKETGLVYVSEYDLAMDVNETLAHKLVVNISRPFVLLFKELIVLLFAIYAAVVYGVLYMMFGAFPVIFQQERGWTSGVGGLPFIGVGVGMIIGIIMNVFVNRKYASDLIANGGILPPEARLPVGAFGGVCLPVGLFWFAWTVQPSVHYIVPILATVPFGLGMVLVFLSTTNYVVDAYLQYSASALAANAVLRCILGAVFPLFTVQMFKALGTNWALTLVAFLSLILMPIPFFFLKYGHRIRARSTFAPSHQPVTMSDPPTTMQKDLAEEVAEADLRLREDERTEKLHELAKAERK